MIDLANERTCTSCGVVKPYEEFYPNKKGKNGRQSSCKPCARAKTREYRQSHRSKEMHRIAMREWARRNPEKHAATKLRARLGKYSLTPDEYMAKLLKQEGRCGACGSDDPGSSYGVWCIDHDRSCCPGKFSCGACLRDLLCNGCNTALGLAREDVDRLLRLADYARRWRHG